MEIDTESWQTVDRNPWQFTGHHLLLAGSCGIAPQPHPLCHRSSRHHHVRAPRGGGVPCLHGPSLAVRRGRWRMRLPGSGCLGGRLPLHSRSVCQRSALGPTQFALVRATRGAANSRPRRARSGILVHRGRSAPGRSFASRYPTRRVPSCAPNARRCEGPTPAFLIGSSVDTGGRPVWPAGHLLASRYRRGSGDRIRGVVVCILRSGAVDATCSHPGRSSRAVVDKTSFSSRLGTRTTGRCARSTRTESSRQGLTGSGRSTQESSVGLLRVGVTLTCPTG